MLHREEHGLEAARHAELLEDVRQMMLDRALRDRALIGNLLVRVTADQQGDDLEFAIRQPEASIADRRPRSRSEEHTSELQSRGHLVCRLLLEKKNTHT